MPHRVSEKGFLPTNIANIYIFSQSMLLWNIISSIIRKLHFSQAVKTETGSKILLTRSQLCRNQHFQLHSYKRKSFNSSCKLRLVKKILLFTVPKGNDNLSAISRYLNPETNIQNGIL